MTDPLARSNFEKYGNPEGYGHFQVSVALPKSINHPGNQVLVLSVFFIVVVFLIPSYFYSQLKEDDRDVYGKVSPENRKRFSMLIDERMKSSVLPGILG